jgi:O-antigen/teichoic acid export membrane protein
MNRLRRVVTNTLVALLGQGITWTSTLLLTIAYGRFLGDAKFGELYFALTFVLLIGLPMQYSFDRQVTRDVAQAPDKAISYFSNVLLMKSCLWVALYALALLVGRLLGSTGEVELLVAICGLTLLSSGIGATIQALHYAFERAFWPVTGSIFEKGAAALAGILLLSHGAGVVVMALVLLGASVINTLWQSFWFFRLVGVGFVPDLGLMRVLTRTGVPFLIYGMLWVIYDRIDIVLLTVMAGDAVVGWYGAGYRLFDTLSFLPAVVMPIMYPIFSRLSTTSEANLHVAMEKTINFLLFFALPIATGLIVIAPQIISLLYHRPEFTHTVPVLQALAPGIVITYVNMVLSDVLVSTGREKKIPIMAGIALLFNLGLNFIFIPLAQHVGAAIVTTLTELLLLGLSLAFLPRQLLPIRSLRTAIKAALASGLMFLAIVPFREAGIVTILLIAVLVYFSAALFLRTIPGEDLRAMFQAIRHKTLSLTSAASASLSAQGEQMDPTEEVLERNRVYE